MSLRTVGELRAALDNFDDDMPLRVAMQPTWPLTCRVVNVTDSEEIARVRREERRYRDGAPEEFGDESEAPDAPDAADNPARTVWIAIEQSSSWDEHPYAPREAWAGER